MPFTKLDFTEKHKAIPSIIFGSGDVIMHITTFENSTVGLALSPHYEKPESEWMNDEKKVYFNTIDEIKEISTMLVFNNPLSIDAFIAQLEEIKNLLNY